MAARRYEISLRELKLNISRVSAAYHIVSQSVTTYNGLRFVCHEVKVTWVILPLRFK